MLAVDDYVLNFQSMLKKKVEGRKNAKVQQDESYHSTEDLAALNTFVIPASHRIRTVFRVHM